MTKSLAGVLLLAALLLSACSFQKSNTSAPAAPTSTIAIPTATAVAQTHEIIGSLLIEPGYHYDGEPCAGQDGYSDIHAGTQITVKDASGQIIALGQLQGGKIEANPAAVYWGRCRLTVVVEQVPDSAFYTFSIGNRPGVTFSRDDLVNGAWGVQLSIGQPDW
jgi:hypothetical protein